MKSSLVNHSRHIWFPILLAVAGVWAVSSRCGSVHASGQEPTTQQNQQPQTTLRSKQAQPQQNGWFEFEEQLSVHTVAGVTGHPKVGKAAKK